MAQGLSGEQYLTMIRELIRLDIPICLVGSSSIGKSYSTREFAMDCGIETTFLFVGTEKAEYLEGIPMIKSADEITEQRKKAEKEGKAVEGMSKFNYLQPYWFPDNAVLLRRGKEGLKQIKKERPDFFKGDVGYVELDSYRTELTRNRVANKDALMVVSMILGYGNFWLVLDEIDKVEENDKDKYAPLLHIVRERELKGWQLSGIRQKDYKGSYDVKDTILMSERVKKVAEAIENDKDITDTRIIAIANATEKLREYSEALYRRFIHIPIRTSLYIENKQEFQQMDVKDGNWAQAEWATRKKELHKCIVSKPYESVKGGATITVLDKMAEIDDDTLAEPLDEMNLQWTLGFLPEMLFPLEYIDISKPENKDYIPNKFVNEFVNKVKAEKKYDYKKITSSTYIGQLVIDNFTENWWKFIMDCIKDSLIKTDTKTSVNLGEQLATDLLKQGGITSVAQFKNPSITAIKGVLDGYIELQKANELQFKNSVQSAATKGVTASTENLVGKLLRFIEAGSYLVMNTMDGKEMTTLSKIMFEIIPAIQLNLMVKSPYISYTNMADAEEERNKGIKEIVRMVTTSKMSSPDEVLSGLNDFNSIVNQIDLDNDYKNLIDEYFYGVSGQEIKEFEDKVVNVSPLKVDKNLKKEFLDKIISYNPVSMPTFKFGSSYQPLLKLKTINDEDAEKILQSTIQYLIPVKSIKENMVKILNDLYSKTAPDVKSKMMYYADLLPKTVKTVINTTQTLPLDSDTIKDVLAKCDSNIQAGIGSSVDSEYI